MGEISFTAIKTQDYDTVLDMVNTYFSKHKLYLVEERVGNHSGKYAKSPNHFANLKEYDRIELEPYFDQNYEFTTNFDFFVNLEGNKDWCLLTFNTRLAEFTLNIDEDLTEFISKEMKVKAFDYYEHTVVDLVIYRSFEKGNRVDKFVSIDGIIDDMEGYFEQLKKIESDDMPEKESEKKRGIIDGFLQHIGYNNVFLNSKDQNSRRPMYLKGNPQNIIEFLKRKNSSFYI